MPVNWIDDLTGALAHGKDALLVTVARTRGSAPREAGAAMVVTEAQSSGTIGGGNLEWQAIGQARAILAAGRRPPEIVRFGLGARLGQCCGGVVWLLFETIPAADRADWLHRQAAVRTGAALRREVDSAAAASVWRIADAPGQAGAWLEGEAGAWRFYQDIAADAFPVYLFGAGHVARALIGQLRLLDARIVCIDSRDDAFAGLDAPGVDLRSNDAPEAEVATAPAGTYFLVMTHSHTLDFALCEAIYRRRDFAYLGLIGSASKRAAFEQRLLARGLPGVRLAELTCPIGIPGIASKAPAAIALSVAAQLLQIHSARRSAVGASPQEHP